MKLDYWILWFEDTPSWLEPILEELAMELEDIGFRLRVQVCKSGKEISEHVQDKRFDLILMDYKLEKIDGEEVLGDELIRQIRQNFDVYTEVVFYSVRSADELRQKIYDKGKLDGVYCFNRDRNFLEGLLKVIQTTVKKVLDTDNMRGIAMASVANCDQHVINSVVERWNQLSGTEKEQVRDKALEKLEKSQKTLSEDLSALKTTDDLRSILESHAYPSKTRFHLLNSITKAKRKCAVVGPVREKIQNYSEILDHRNRLGHAKAIEKAGVVVFEGHDGVTYDSDAFKDLRKNMIINEEALETLHKLILDKKLD